MYSFDSHFWVNVQVLLAMALVSISAIEITKHANKEG